MSELTKLVSYIDLTNLSMEADATAIEQLCNDAETALGPVAAVCVFPQFISLAKLLLPNIINVATVINFPEGNGLLSDIAQETKLADAADELDIVIPYNDVIKGNMESTTEVIQCCKEYSNDKLIKVILETGALKDPDLIYRTSLTAIKAGANFIKTSTGKIPEGASIEAAKAILHAIKDSNDNTGIKISGGVRVVAEAERYIDLITDVMGEHWITPKHFRIGASSLLADINKIACHPGIENER